MADELVRARETLDVRGHGGRVIGLAGTVSTLGSLSRGLVKYDRNRVHHTELSSDDVELWLDRLASEPLSAARSDRAWSQGERT